MGTEKDFNEQAKVSFKAWNSYKHGNEIEFSFCDDDTGFFSFIKYEKALELIVEFIKSSGYSSDCCEMGVLVEQKNANIKLFNAAAKSFEKNHPEFLVGRSDDASSVHIIQRKFTNFPDLCEKVSEKHASIANEKNKHSGFDVGFMLKDKDDVLAFLKLAFNTFDYSYISEAMDIANSAVKKMEYELRDECE